MYHQMMFEMFRKLTWHYLQRLCAALKNQNNIKANSCHEKE